MSDPIIIATGSGVASTARGAGLSLRGVSAGYFGHTVVEGIDIDAPWGEITAVFGHNGAGKTTILRTIAGIVARQTGEICLDDREVSSLSTRQRVQAGISYLPEDHATFPGLTVFENLEMGTIAAGGRRVEERATRVFELFPVLGERRRSAARTLSGGQQRMLSIGMALMANARVLLLDEPSLGLAPAVIQSLLQQVTGFAREDGCAIVLVEQAIGEALHVVDHVYVVRAGRVIASLPGETAREREDWSEVF